MVPMIRHSFEDPARDPRLGEVLRRSETPLSPEGDDALRARVVWEARGRLAARRLAPRTRPWWSWMAGWARVALPMGLAASVAAGALVLRTPIDEGSGTEAGVELAVDAAGASADTVALSYVLLTGANADGAVRVVDHVLGTGDGDWLLGDPTTTSR
jgi:hypothetical protein